MDAVAALHSIGLEISANRDLPDLLTFIIQTATDLLEIEGHGTIYLVDPANQKLRGAAAIGISNPFIGTEMDPDEGLAGKVYVRNELMAVADYVTWEGRSHRFEFGNFHAIMSVPLRWQDQIIGVLNLASGQSDRQFTEDDIRLAELFATQAAIAINNWRLAEAESKSREHTEAILKASLSLSSTLSLKEVLEMILAEVGRVLPYKAAIVASLEEGLPRVTAVVGFDDPEGAQNALSRIHYAEDPIFQRIVRDQQTVLIENVRDQPGWETQPETVSIRGWMGVPLVVRDQTVGVLMLDSDQIGAYQEQHAERASAFAAAAAVAIENARIYQALEQQAEHLELLVAERTEELARRQEELNLILESAGEGIIYINPDGLLNYANRAWYTITGFSPKEALGKTTIDLFRSDPKRVQEQQETLRSGRTWTGTICFQRPDATEYDANITLTPVFEDGDLTHMVGVFRDVTAEMDAARLQHKFVSNVSHELRTPITTLKLYHSLLISGSPEKQGDYLTTMKAELSRLERLIEDLLDVARLDQNAMPIHLAPTDLNTLVRNVIDFHRTRAEHQGLRLEIELADNLPPVSADRDRLIQALANLLTNAINYTSAGDTVGVRTWIDGRNGELVVIMSVWDTGRGIKAEDLPHVFQRFYRAKSPPVEGVPGTGLGLSIVKEIVEMHAGTITAESIPGKRTTFTVSLPVKM